MNQTLYQKGSYQVIQFNESLSVLSRINELEKLVIQLLEDGQKNIALKFKDGTYLNFHSCAVIIKCHEAIMEKGGDLAIINSNRDIRDFLEVVGFEKKIEIYSSDSELP